MPRLRWPPRLDLLIAAGLIVLSLCEVWLNRLLVPKPAAAVCEVAAAAAVAWRRLMPLTAISVAGVACVAEAAAGVPMRQPAVPLVCAVILTYSLVSYVPLRRALIGTGLLVVWITAQIIAAHQTAGTFQFAALFIGGAWAMGRLVRIRAAQAAAAQHQADRLAAEKDAETRRAAAEERGRIARELHDIVAHSVSVMVVQAGAAEQILPGDQAGAAAAMRAVQQAGREAIAELSRLLGVLRDGGQEVGVAPLPTLAELPALIDQSRGAGLPVDMTVLGEPRPLPAGVELAVYRIIQEALTNTRKHAGAGSAASVELTYDQAAVTAEIRDNGPGHAARHGNGAGTGNGLAGLQARASAYGGSLEAGPAADGGFRVLARIPALEDS
jgi:signal transduction histidine kinase